MHSELYEQFKNQLGEMLDKYQDNGVSHNEIYEVLIGKANFIKSLYDRPIAYTKDWFPIYRKNNVDKAKRPCSGTFCPMNRNFDVGKCNLAGECEYYMPLADTSRMESVIDMAIKIFDLKEEDRHKLDILFNIYVSQYMAEFCCL